MNDRMIGHYRIIELLGSGAMGTVHVAVDTYIDRPVAIKSLRPELTQDPDFVSRFRAEAKSLARLNHPNIATLFSPIMDGTDLYLVMELVQGKALDDILRDRAKPLGVKESLAIIAQAADGLSYAHEMGVIHRDIKPANLMIANDGRVKIMDFGIARVQGSVRLTRSGTAVGTPLYMSPEQCRGGEGDERSDIYSLAIVLYEMLKGSPPFNADTEYELIQQQIGSTPAPLVPKVAGVTPSLESAIMKALAKKPEQRFHSMRAFSDALGATALRPDATGVIRNANHLIAPNEDPIAKTPTNTVDVMKSRALFLSRRWNSLEIAAKSVAVAGLAIVLATTFFFFRSPGVSDETQQTNHTAPVVALTTPPPRSGDANDVASKLNELRMAITGSTANKIRASDFEYVTNGVKVQLLSSAKLLAAAGNAEGQFVLGMLLLETPGNIDINGAFDALAKAAQQNYPDAQVNLALIYQRGLLPGGRDLDKASYWFEKAADNGNAKAQFWLGCYYQYGWGDRTRDSQKSIEEYGKAVAANYAPAREALEVVNGGSAAASPCSK